MNMFNSLVMALLLLVTVSAPAAVKLPRVFGPNMVLQRDRPVPVWGWAKPGEAITLSFAGQNKTTTAGADGKWRILLDPLAASKDSRELIVKGENELVLKNILVGEVWLCSGQSNMAFQFDSSLDFETEKAGATNGTIRQFTTPYVYEPFPQEDVPGGDWVVCEPGTVGGFSAVGYFFAREISKELGVPVGLFLSAAGGTQIEAWECVEGLRLVPELKGLCAAVDESLPNTDAGQPRYQAYYAKLKEWLPKAEAAVNAKQMIPVAPVPPWMGPGVRPTKLYNTKIAPLSKYAMRGALWYQGETNNGEDEPYFHKMKALVGGWRQVWGQGDFPFYFVQLPNFKGFESNGNSPGGGGGFVNVREAQRKSLAITNTGMAVAIDLGETNDIHPKNKQDVGKRLALWALAKDYHKKVAYSGPLYQNFQVEGTKIRIHFDYAQGGLIAGQKSGLEPVKGVIGGKMTCFAIAGKDKVFYWADAVIEGQTVVVSSSKVVEPVAVRYAFANNPECLKLYNKEGLPASPFRTDNW